MTSPSIHHPNGGPIRSQYEDFMRHVYTTGVPNTEVHTGPNESDELGRVARG